MTVNTRNQYHESTVCIVGGGPAGVMLAYLLARNNISVTLLEAQRDFDREFRGDTIHAAIMENMAQLGLAHRLLALPHYKMSGLSIRDSHRDERLQLIDFSRLKTEFPYVTMMAQADFLNFMVQEAAQFPGFNLLMGTAAQQLIQENGVVQGVRFQARDGEGKRHGGEVHAALTIAADGRSSRLRKLTGLEPIPITDPMDVLWFRIPKIEADAGRESAGLTGGGRLPFIQLERQDHWQCGLVFPHGGYKMLRGQGIESFHEHLAEAAPEFAQRARTLYSQWSDIAWLSVAGSRLKKWHQPGLLFIGDAAHVMTPMGGVGINYAIQDAIVAANVLVKPLTATGRATEDDLAEIQRQREWPTRVIQQMQKAAQKRILRPEILQGKPFVLPRFMTLLPHIPILRDLPGRLISAGVRRVNVEVV